MHYFNFIIDMREYNTDSDGQDSNVKMGSTTQNFCLAFNDELEKQLFIKNQLSHVPVPIQPKVKNWLPIFLEKVQDVSNYW